MKPLDIGLINHSDGSPSTNFEESIHLLLDYHFPQDTTEDDTEFHVAIRTSAITPPVSQPEEHQLTMKELSAAINGLANGKAPGLDGLNLEIIKYLFKHFGKIFLALYQTCFRLGIFPSQWKVGDLVLFHKNNKTLSEASSYRPICLLPALSKVLDRLVTDRLMHFMISGNHLSNLQFGFVPTRSTTQALGKLLSIIRSNLDLGLHTSIILLDAANAFNSVWPPGILSELSRLRCPINLWNLVNSFLKGRKIRYRLGGQVFWREFSRGCPQGSCSGPLLWDILANTFLLIDLGDGIYILAFADDFVVIITGTSRQKLEGTAATALIKILDWASKWKVTLSHEKTKCLHFRAGRKPRWAVRPYFRLPNGKALKNVKSAKYLGVTIEETLHWTEHLRELKERLSPFGYRLSTMIRQNWGLGSSALKKIYKGALERALVYAAPVWWRNASTTMIRMVRSIQRQSAISVSRSFRTVSTDAALVLAGMEPVELVLERESTTGRLFQLREGTSIWNKELDPGEFVHPLDLTLIHPAARLSFGWSSSEEALSGRIKIFTDGSRDDNNTGSAFVVFREGIAIHTEEFALRHENSSFQAEGFAILMAVEYLLTESLSEADLFSDSRSVLQALSNTRNNDPLIFRIKEKLAKPLLAGVRLFWVKAHAGIEGNEQADMAAKRASISGREISDLPFPRSYLKTLLRKEVILRWQRGWVNSSKGRQTFTFFPSVKIERLQADFFRNHLITGHGFLPAYFGRFAIEQSGTCACGTEGTAFHYIRECELTLDYRQRLVNACDTAESCSRAMSCKTDLEVLSQLSRYLMENRNLFREGATE